ncbi:MAG: TMEM175 family protein [bacterium]
MALKRVELSTRRIEALTDGIFAIAMTLLILNFNIPGTLKGIDAGSFIVSQSDRLFNYFLSFVLLAIFWLVNNQIYHHIKKTDTMHLWLNIVTLMFVVFIPFSASLISQHPDTTAGEFFFALNIFLVSVSTQFGWIYATQERRLISEESEEERLWRSIKRGWVSPLVSGLAMIMAFVEPKLCSHIYLSIPVILWLPWFK